MPFNSLDFAIFFLIFYLLYLVLLKLYRLQNFWLLAASYFFYAFWDWRFLAVLLAITAFTYLLGLALGAQDTAGTKKTLLRRVLLVAGLLFNLGTLFFFKYADFFSAGLLRIFNRLDIPLDTLLADILLPVGLSFYALQAASYLLDVSARRTPPARNLLGFALFVAFFPQLLAGPIERAGRMLPQFNSPRQLTPASVSSGIYLLFSGFFKKLVIADNLGLLTAPVFDNFTAYSGVDLLLAVLAFTFQLYADFSAYSDIARGLARLLGFELMVNFRLPYFSTSPSDFWSRWHISLSEWLRDYIFFPLRRSLLRLKGQVGRITALIVPPLITMLVSGFWHGTGWNFLLWGFYHGLLLILFQLLIKERPQLSPTQAALGEGAVLAMLWSWIRPRLITAARIAFMFILVCFGWLIFRVDTPQQLVYFLSHISLQASSGSALLWENLVLFTLPLLVVQLVQQGSGDLLVLARLPFALRALLYAVALALMVALGARQAAEFIYVQF